MTRVNIELDGELHKQAKMMALAQGKTLIEYVIFSLENKIGKEDKKK